MRILRGVLVALLISSAALAQTQPAETQRLIDLGSRGVRAHDPSTIIRCGDEYWCYWTGRGIHSLHSRDLVKWEQGPPIFQAAPKWNKEIVPATRELVYWAPDVIHLGERYLLYYSV